MGTLYLKVKNKARDLDEITWGERFSITEPMHLITTQKQRFRNTISR